MGKSGRVIHWVHAFKIDQVVIMGAISISPGAVAYLLQQGIDTVFLSIYGKYRGRLVSDYGKNVELRYSQFSKIGDPDFKLSTAKSYVSGKIYNCRLLLRKLNQSLHDEKVQEAVHRLRSYMRASAACETIENLMGVEGAAANAYFGCFGKLIKAENIIFTLRNRRPPRDPMNVLLSLGYTLLANAVHTQVHVAGLDPYLGCLHSPEYGRPSLVLDIMEEFRPTIVDLLALRVFNKGIIKATDFYKPEDREPAAFDFAELETNRSNYPILLTHEGMKKFITAFENRLQTRVLYLPTGKQLSYRDIILEQVRLFVRTLSGACVYQAHRMR